MKLGGYFVFSEYCPMKYIIVYFLFVCTFSCFANVQKKSYKIAYPNLPPICYTNSSGKAAGVTIEKTRKIFNKLNLDYQFLELPSKRIFALVNRGRIDVVIGPDKIPSIEQSMLVTKKKLHNITINSFRLHSIPKITSLDDFKGKIVAAHSQYSLVGIKKFFKSPENSVNLIELDTHEVGLLLLEKKRVDYYVNYATNVKESTLNKVKFAIDPVRTIPIHLLVNKTLGADAKLLIQRIDQN